MEINDCKGCIDYDSSRIVYCDLGVCVHYGNVQCPCSICLVKGMCETECDKFIHYISKYSRIIPKRRIKR